MSHQPSPSAPNPSGLAPWREILLASGGDMGRLVVEFDWGSTPLGEIDTWPPALKAAAAVCLTSKFPILLLCGPDLRMVYNDGYRPLLGQSKHPAALGAPVRQIWAEIWDVIGPMLDGVTAGGPATWSQDQKLVLDRSGFVEEAHLTFSYSPVVEQDGRITGVITPVTETTARLVGEDRLRTLVTLAGDLMEATDVDDVCARAMKALACDEGDIRYAGLFQVGAGPWRPSARLHAPDRAAALVAALRESPSFRRHVDDVARLGIGRVVEVPMAVLAGSGLDPGSARAYVTVVPEPGVAERSVLGVGLNPQRPWDAEYQAFLDLCASHVGVAMTAARGFAAERGRAEALAELDAAKTAFFTNVSHELRTPLTLIAGPVEELLEASDPPLAPQHREQLELVRRNGQRLRRLVDAILDFSRFESGQLAPSRQAVDLAAATAELAASFAPAMKAGGLTFTWQCPALPGEVFVDRDMWERVVLNLLSNAMKYTLRGSVRLELRDAGEMVELSVEDTGIGIPVEQLPRVFERFQRIEDSRGRSHEGAGIGLAMVDKFVDLLGGSVSVESAVDEGSTFTVRIPYGEPTERPEGTLSPSKRGTADFVEEALSWTDEQRSEDFLRAARPPTLPHDDGSRGALSGEADRPHLLVVEDSRDMGVHLTRLLHGTFDVELAHDGADALERMRRRRPDIVLSDIVMPTTDGITLLKEVREDPDLANVPVVLLSARSGEEAAAQGFAAGADDYLVKPFSAVELQARLWANLERATARSRDAAWRSAMIRSMSDAVVIGDDTGAVFEVNSAFELMLGWGQAGGPYAPPYPWRPDPEAAPEEAEQHDRTWEQLREEGFGEWEVPMRHREGHTVWTSMRSGAVLSGSSGTVYIATLRDVSREHTRRQRRAAAAGLSAELVAADTLEQVLTAAVRGFGELFNGDSTVRVVAAPSKQPTLMDASGPMDEADLSEAVRLGLSGPRDMADTNDVVNGLLISPTGADSDCVVWVAFAVPRTITPDERIVGDMLAEAFGAAVDRVVREERHADRETNLARAVDSHRLVGQAIGILIERHRLTPAEAFERLKVASQERNVKLREIARRVIETGQEPREAG
jgi:PAS domain S-box-containing protein